MGEKREKEKKEKGVIQRKEKNCAQLKSLNYKIIKSLNSLLYCKLFQVNPLGENCYVVSDETREAVIIDCGAKSKAEFMAISQYIEDENLHPIAHLLTHAHFDHIYGVPYVYEAYGLKPRCHAADASLYNKMHLQVVALMGEDLDREMPPLGDPIDVSAKIRFGNHGFSVFETPGHTPGGICFYEKDEKVLFSGDSLFRMSIGRTDFPGGSFNALIGSLTSMFATLPPDVVIYPGHGPKTTVSFELSNNPYL